MLKKYRMSFDVWGLVLFLAIMIPNFFWFAIPAPNDILRNESVTETLDMIASVCQVIMVFALCAVVNQNCQKTSLKRPLVIVTIICCLLYFVAWVFYYIGITNALTISGLFILPCLAFLFYAFDRRNIIAVVPITIFSICHVIYGVVNFIA